MLDRLLRIPAVTALVIATVMAVSAPVYAQVDTGIRPVALVTGSTDGLGREIALRLAGAGFHVIVHGRNEEGGREVVDSIRAREGSAALLLADLGSMAEVRALVDRVRRDYDRLDVLVNNAGIGRGADVSVRSESQDGYELRFAVNYFSHFYLTHALLPLLRSSAPAQIVSVTSVAQEAIDFDDLMLEEDYVGTRAYARSKLAQIMMTLDLAEELEGTGVTANAVHPAIFMATSMVLDRGGTPMASIDEGADPVLQVIMSPVAGSGHYYRQAERAEPHEQPYDENARRRLRQITRERWGPRRASPKPSSPSRP